MPRLTNHHYLKLHHHLQNLWRNHQQAYSYLSPTDQYYLHDYFQPSKALSADELFKHRKLITAERPSPPQQAGRAVAKLERAAQLHASQQPALPSKRANRRNTEHQLTVRSAVNPNFNVQKYAELVVMFAKQRECRMGKR